MGLANEAGELATGTFDVVVVGSGYGAGVLAARLSAGGQLRVCILERGREFGKDDFPNDTCSATEELQLDSRDGHLGSDLGLFDLRVNDAMSVLVGCGLGGTSLINANVSILPSAQVFADAAWPAPLRDADPTKPGDALAVYYERAKRMLRPSTMPVELPKLAILKRMAEACEAPVYDAHINVNFVDGVNDQRACNYCGNCMTGCRYEAKNTLCFTYLPLAKKNGAKIFTHCEVRSVEKVGDEWLVHYQRHGGDLGQVRAKAVVLGAGTLGSTEIMLRSKAAGLAVSSRLGQRFSSNGDSLAFGYNLPTELDSVGFGRTPRKDHPAGPSITGIVDLRDPKLPLNEQIIIEDGAFPGGLRALERYALELGALSNDRESKVPIRQWLGRRWRELLDLIGVDPLDGVLNHSEIFLVIGHDMIGDLSGGNLALDNNERVRVVWPHVADLPVFRAGDEWTTKLAFSVDGCQVHNPLWKSRILGSHLITVHPLGGCSLAEDAARGVVNERGQVFDGKGGVHDTLFIADGSIVPTSVGVNPLWTISALAERIADLARVQFGLAPMVD